MKSKEVAKLISDAIGDDADSLEFEKPHVILATFGSNTFSVTVEEYDAEEDDSSSYTNDDEEGSLFDKMGDT